METTLNQLSTTVSALRTQLDKAKKFLNIDDAKDQADDNNKDTSEFTLYYHRYGFGGRGTLIRFAFELAGIKYIEGTADDGNKNKGADIDLYPNFAFPIIKHNNDLISQTPVICEYILDISNIGPNNPLKRAQSKQVALTAADLFSEWFGKGDAIEDDWITDRAYKYMEVLENQLKRNNNGNGFYFGDSPCIADLFVADMMRRFKRVKPDLWKDCKYTCLKEHVKRFEEYPKIKAFLESDRYTSTIGDQTTGKMGFLAL